MRKLIQIYAVCVHSGLKIHGDLTYKECGPDIWPSHRKCIERVVSTDIHIYLYVHMYMYMYIPIQYMYRHEVYLIPSCFFFQSLVTFTLTLLCIFFCSFLLFHFFLKSNLYTQAQNVTLM